MSSSKPSPEPNDDEPLDADLIAYLDGELEDDAAKEVEDRLTNDSQLRRRAEAYKKTFDLLDYLPKREPTADFATRTITRLQPAVTVPHTPSEGQHSSNPSASGVSMLGSGAMPSTRGSWIPRIIFGILAILAGVGGYFGHAALKPILEPSRQLSLEDISLIEMLPLYYGVDDLEFAQSLDTADLFGTDPLNPTPAEFIRQEVTTTGRDKLTELFKSFSAVRQEQLRELHNALNKLPAEKRTHLFRVLENYAVWLERLPDPERREVLSAQNATARLEAIQMTMQRLWRASLPIGQREQLKKLADVEEIQRKVTILKNTERYRKEEWKLSRQQKETPLGPFEDPKDPKKVSTAFVKEVEQFLKQTMFVEQSMLLESKSEPPRSCRLTREELMDLRIRYDAATKDGKDGEWFNFGLLVHRLAERHPYLPESGKKPPIVDFPGIRKEMGNEFKPKAIANQLEKFEKRPNVNNSYSNGKWPDFALEFAENVRRATPGAPLEWLGPCTPGQFNDSVNQFYTTRLLPKLNDKQKSELRSAEGKWPDYPRLLIRLAKDKDESIPGVTLPGKPSLWAKYYTIGKSKE
jgi:hypothetical protein